MGTPNNQTTHNTRQRVFLCVNLRMPNYGGSGGAAL
ncbi:TPA: hypothetical protein OTP91_003803 [Enterobacter hormaechei]|uniref:Uncharacterized protein n=1 Tax=Enterobacter sichuanensis TaxID=2071710 RepID=A0ABS6GJL0_9ENTR|nr:hypothetical protein [Enterobacter hormaechei]EMB9960159.1 hypothetical protein [Escherichia coli]MBU5926665.1 hypothetical protein [Enterobacter sichuanensis]HCQ6989722.1 hypothetical protein [Enterobacter hormaechei]HCT1844435.1 hypothetical protein [Enterobacter hormaechei]